MKHTITKLSLSAMGLILIGLVSEQANAQIFVSNFSGGAIGEYNLDGSTVNSSLISVSQPYGLVVEGSDLIYASRATNSIYEYDLNTHGTTTLATGLSRAGDFAATATDLYVPDYNGGNLLDYSLTSPGSGPTTLLSGLTNPLDVAISGTDLLITNYASGTFSGGSLVDYSTLTSGSTVLVSGLNGPTGVAVSGTTVYIANSASSTLVTYNTLTTGTAILVSGLSNPYGVAVGGGNVFVSNAGGNSVGEYSATTGTAVNSALVTGLSTPVALDVVDTPEPSTWALLAMGLFSLAGLRFRLRGQV